MRRCTKRQSSWHMQSSYQGSDHRSDMLSRYHDDNPSLNLYLHPSFQVIVDQSRLAAFPTLEIRKTFDLPLRTLREWKKVLRPTAMQDVARSMPSTKLLARLPVQVVGADCTLGSYRLSGIVPEI